MDAPFKLLYLGMGPNRINVMPHLSLCNEGMQLIRINVNKNQHQGPIS